MGVLQAAQVKQCTCQVIFRACMISWEEATSHLAAQPLLSKVADTLASMPLPLLLQTDLNPSQATFPSAPHFSEQEPEPCEGPRSWQVWPLSASLP